MKKVLVVDDTKLNRILLTKCLEEEGYKVATASNGLEALKALDEEEFDLIFLDIKMPKMSGTEVFKKMKENRICTPVVITTAYATVKNAVECTKLGAIAYLQKPFTADKIRSVLIEIEDTLSCNKAAFFDEIKIEMKADPEKALNLLKKAISLNPNDAEIYLLFSQVYAKIGDIEHSDKFLNMYNILKK